MLVLLFCPAKKLETVRESSRSPRFASDRDDRGDYMEITGSPLSSQSSQTRAHTVEELESANLLWARNGFKMAARNRRAGLAAIYLTVLAVIRRRREKKLRRKHQPEPDLTFFFFFENRPYAVQIFLHLFSASAVSIPKISPVFSNSFNFKVLRTCYCILVRICCRDIRAFALLH